MSHIKLSKYCDIDARLAPSKQAGEEMVKSLKIMFNRILKEHSIPRQWTEMTIKSIHKKGSKMLMENRRGL